MTAQPATDPVADTHQTCTSCHRGRHACQGTVPCAAGCSEEIHTCAGCGSKPETWMALADVSP